MARLNGSFARLSLVLLAVALAAYAVKGVAASGETGPGPMTRAEAFQRAAALRTIGRALFFDAGLSASGRQSCSSCHDPEHAFGPPSALPVQMGGSDMGETGFRAAPSLRYLQAVPAFTEHFFDSDDEGDESVDNGPTGGLTWDGRVDRGRDQARIPLLSPFEMGNRDAADVAVKLEHARYAGDFRTLFGANVFADPEAALAGATEALAAFEEDAERFYPYSSKYDAYLAGRASLTPIEAKGLALFNDPEKGNCASCHISARANDGEPPQFTDYGFLGLGVPRNDAIRANADPSFFDLGLCGPLRRDLADRPDYCGLFRTPTLRNVALRQTFFHNGRFHSLRDAVAFYATRDTDPGRWYPKRPDGSVDVFDDLPRQYWDNINRDAPFGGKPGGKPALDDPEIDAVVAFLNTLTDGYEPKPAKP